MSWSLVANDAVLTYGDDGKLDGGPLTAVGDAQAAIDEKPRVAGTPTGPWFERGTSEHAWLILRPLMLDAEVVGEPPVLPDVGDELPEPDSYLHEARFDPSLHPRDRVGRWAETFDLGEELPFERLPFVERLRRHIAVLHPGNSRMFGKVQVSRAPSGHYEVIALDGPIVAAGDAHEAARVAADKGAPSPLGPPEEDAGGRVSVLDPDTFGAIFDGFEHGGLRACVDFSRAGFVEGTILAGDYYAGSFAREAFERDGQTVVYHEKLALGVEYQGRGFGTAFFEHSVEQYRMLGVDKVTVTAASTVGGYQWAQRGFDFDVERAAVLSYAIINQHQGPCDVSSDERFARAWSAYDLYRQRFEQGSFAEVKSQGDVPTEQWHEFLGRFPKLDQLHAYLDGDDDALDGTFTTPAEIANFGRDQHRWTETRDRLSLGREMWLGKRFMLGAAWRGVRRLRP